MRSDRTRELVRAHRPHDQIERAHLERMLILLADAEERAFERDHWTPGHFTASAFVLAPSADALLLIHHAKLDRWLQPGGHIEATDANPFEAALREVEEEVGVHRTLLTSDGALFDVDVHPIPARKSDPPHEHFDLRFLLMAQNDRFVAGEEVKGARWFPLESLEETVDDESVARAARKLRAVVKPA